MSKIELSDDLVEAVMLVKGLLSKAVALNIDPKALRVAYKFLMMVDDYQARKHGLSESEDRILTAVAKGLFMGIKKKKDNGWKELIEK